MIPTATLGLFLVALATSASETRIFRCIDGSGASVFADRPCHMLDAHTFPRAGASEAAVEIVEESAGSEEDPALRAARCPAADGTALIAAVEDVFARRDLNGYAALYHWVGATRSYAFLVMERMERMLKEPLIEVAFEPEMPEESWSVDETALPDLRIDTGVDNFDDRRSTFFRLRRHAGCLWLVL
ncbi:MAG TPA: hypothetical protein PKZ76_09980 [Xanthomonadaceae bacterium]|nr:hypothetical protein [Xanthomonadaceae bacterium]